MTERTVMHGRPEPRMSVIIVTHNSEAALANCLQSLTGPGLPDEVEVTVWDNASTDATATVAARYPCAYIDSDANVGFAVACNAAVARTRGTWILLLNPDCTVGPGFLPTLLRGLPTWSENYLLAPAVHNPDGTPQDAFAPLPTPLSEIAYALLGRAAHRGVDSRVPRYLSGACLLVSRTAWQRLGGFDEGYYLYGEDADLSRRAVDGGFTLRTLEGVSVRHDGSQGLWAKTPRTIRLLVSGKVSYVDRFHGRAAASSVLAAYRLGALLRLVHAGARLDPARVSLCRAVLTLRARDALWFGRSDFRSPIRVVAWPGLRHADRNPYTTELYRAMRHLGAGVGDIGQVGRLIGSTDILHLHWPEAPLNVPGTGGALLRTARVVLLAYLVRLRGGVVVWTVHNLGPHDRRHPSLTRLFYRVWLKLVGALVFNTSASRHRAIERWPALSAAPSLVSAIPSYRGIHEPSQTRDDARHRLGVEADDLLVAFLGHLRRYKGVERLIGCIGELSRDDPRIRLLVAGSAADPQYAQELRRRAAAVPGAIMREEFLPADEVGNVILASDLLVFPLEKSLNSSSVLLGLSYGRAVLAPSGDTNRELQERYGDELLMLYDPPLSAEALRGALRRVRTASNRPPTVGIPSFMDVAAEQLTFFRRVLEKGSVCAR